MRRLAAIALIVALVAPAAVSPSASAGGPCPGGQVHVRGRVTDAATGQPLREVTSVGIEQLDGPYSDGEGTNENSRWSTCLPPGEYQFTFAADSYRQDQAAGVQATVAEPGPVVIDVALTPRGKVLAGRVTNRNGRPQFASVGIYRLTSRGWRSIDGIGTDPATGIWSYRVPRVGRYRIAAFVDHHWARWHRDGARLRDARPIVVRPDTTYIRNLDIRVPYCRRSPDICIPWGFTS